VKKTGIILICVLIGLTAYAAGSGPTEAIQNPMDQVLAILKDPQYEPAERKAAQRDKMWEAIQTAFDFQEISRRTLAADWRLLSAAEQQEFVMVFSEFLGYSYLDKIQGEYKNEKVLYLGQEMLSESKALIKTRIVRENNVEFPVDYRMQQEAQGWKIYDVNIEGVSLVQNYRSQFQSILLNQNAAQLIEQLKTKLKEQESK